MILLLLAGVGEALVALYGVDKEHDDVELQT